VTVGQDPAELRTRLPEWFVYTDFQLPPLALQGPLTGSEREFWGMIKQSSLYGRKPEHEEERRAHLSFVSFSQYDEPHDMRYVNPHVYIYRKAKRSRRPGLAPAPPVTNPAPATPASRAPGRANYELQITNYELKNVIDVQPECVLRPKSDG